MREVEPNATASPHLTVNNLRNRPCTMTTRTNEMPLPGGAAQQRDVEALDKPSVYELMVKMDELSIELRATLSSEEKMANAIRDDQDKGRPMFLLLHSMGRSMLHFSRCRYFCVRRRWGGAEEHRS